MITFQNPQDVEGSSYVNFRLRCHSQIRFEYFPCSEVAALHTTGEGLICYERSLQIATLRYVQSGHLSICSSLRLSSVHLFLLRITSVFRHWRETGWTLANVGPFRTLPRDPRFGSVLRGGGCSRQLSKSWELAKDDSRFLTRSKTEPGKWAVSPKVEPQFYWATRKIVLSSGRTDTSCP